MIFSFGSQIILVAAAGSIQLMPILLKNST